MIFLQQLQYNAPNIIYVFKNLSGSDASKPSFGIETQNLAPPLPNPGCTPAGEHKLFFLNADLKHVIYQRPLVINWLTICWCRPRASS